MVSDNTLLFGVHLYRPLYAQALDSNLPAIFVGTGWDIWDRFVLAPLFSMMCSSNVVAVSSPIQTSFDKWR